MYVCIYRYIYTHIHEALHRDRPPRHRAERHGRPHCYTTIAIIIIIMIISIMVISIMVIAIIIISSSSSN